jgi:signal recognition particle receptor subunit beta
VHRLEKVRVLKMETVIESILGKGTLAQEQLTYVKYFLLLIVTLITIQLSRIIMSKIFSASQVAGKKHILIVGAEKTGKTVLANIIVKGNKPYNDTVTSMKPTQRTGTVDGISLTLTDFPGSSQARDASLGAQLATATGVVFLVDGRFDTMTDEARASAALMKRVLVQSNFRGRKIPLLVAFNKIDLLSGNDCGKVGDTLESSNWLLKQRNLLQMELDSIKDDLLTLTGDTKTNNDQLGTEQAFEFEMDVDSDVTFCCCTTENGIKGVKDVVQFCKKWMK